MDWKILLILVGALVVFFITQQCSDDKAPQYDRIQAEERAQREQAYAQQQSSEKSKEVAALRADARKNRGERPAPESVSLTTDEYLAEFTTRGGAVRKFKLLAEQYKQPPRDWATGLRVDDTDDFVPVDLVTTNVDMFEQYAPLRFEVLQGIDQLLPDSDYTIVESTKQHVLFKLSRSDLPIEIYKKFEVHPDGLPYELWLTVRVVNKSDSQVAFMPAIQQQGYQHPSETEGGMFSKQPNLQQVICRHDTEVFRSQWLEPDDKDLPYSGIGGIEYVGVESNYFLSAMIPGDNRPASCFLQAFPNRVMRAELRYGEVQLDPGEQTIFQVKNYLGPKKFDLLQQAGHGLESSVDFGFFTPISRVLLWLLLAFQAAFTNWGVAIILLTVLVKLVLIPLTHRSFKSAEKMKALKPEVDKLNEKFPDDPQAKQQAIMELYKHNKVNPLGGCLPMLLQMPIWFALFRTLRASPELYRAPFFGWITDLSSPDPYFITPVVMGGMMFLQQRFTPMTGDSAQQKMMGYVMPIMFSGFMLFLPSGLTLYILVNTVLSIVHQAIVHRRPRALK